MENLPIISVIITSFNKRAYIKDSIESVYIQNYPKDKIDLIVVDDCSQDGSDHEIQSKLNTLDIPTRFIRHPVNQGTAASRNSGILGSNPDSIAFQMLDGDDLLNPNCLINRAIVLMDKPILGMIYSDFESYNSNTGELTKEYRPHFNALENLNEYICGTNVMLSRKVITSIGLYNTNFPTIEDYEISLRVSRYSFIEHLCSFDYIYCHNDSQKTEYMLKHKVKDLNDEYVRLHAIKQELFGKAGHASKLSH